MRSRLSRAVALAGGFTALALAAMPLANASPLNASPLAANRQAVNVSAPGRALAPGTRFFVPRPPAGSVAQIKQLASEGGTADALLVAEMVTTPQAVWFDGTTPSGAQQTPVQVAEAVHRTMIEAALEDAVPVLVMYNIPGRDCAQYSAGGATSDQSYQDWATGFAKGLGNGQAVVIVEPDSLANDPSSCPPGSYSNWPTPPTDTSRFADIAFDVKTLEADDPNASVYLDAGHSAWVNVGEIAYRLVQSDVGQAQGFFLDVSNYQYTQNNVFYGNWVSDCITYITQVDPSAGDSETDANNACPNQYWNGGPDTNWTGTALSPYGVWQDISLTTWDSYTAQQQAAALPTDAGGLNSNYANLLNGAAPITHYVIDTSRNGQGPNDMATYAGAPYDQTSNIISNLQSGNWCNPPDSGLGLPPTADPAADTSIVEDSLLDAFLWVKTPGQSDGQCDLAGAVRNWDDSAYTPPNIPNWPQPTSPTFNTFDPLWSLDTGTVFTDPAAGAWFPQQALQLAQRANPPLSPLPTAG